jgi:hypothetical protein
MTGTINPIKIYRARTMGIFILLAFPAYGFGRHFFDSTDLIQKYAGGFLILANSALVLFIGILFAKTLRQYHLPVGKLYLITRMVESIALAGIVLNLIPNVRVSADYGYFIAMVVLGLGSIPMCWVLYKHRISPAWLALWGAGGYAVFALGFLGELLGHEWSWRMLTPAALWEITFAIWLIARREI